MKFIEWANKWINVYRINHLSEKTYGIYLDIINNHFAPYMGDIKLDNVDYEFVENYIINKKSTLSNASINLHLSILKSIIKDAVDNDVISKNKIAKIKMLKSNQKKINSFSVKEQYLIEDYCIKSEKDYYTIGIILTLYTGLRIGELVSLTWDDIDFNNSVLNINKTESRIRIDGKWNNVVKEPKTIKSNRIIPLGKEILSLLKKLKKKKYGKYVVTNNIGDKVLIRTYQHFFKRLQEEVGITNVLNFHSLRHTFATRAIESGMDIKTLSEILGHSNTAITLNIYVHSMFETKKKAIQNLSKMMALHNV